MANTITKQTIVDGSKYLVVHIYIQGDGVTGDETNTVLIDASTYSPAFTNESVEVIHANLNGFEATLLWDATVNVPFYHIPQYEVHYSASEIKEAIPNNAGAGKTGDILITTNGLSPVTDRGVITLKIKKKPA